MGKMLSRYLLPSLIFILAVLGALVVFYNTQENPWGFTDAIAYLVSARNLLRGIGLGYHYPNGVFNLLTHYPPFYPLILSALGIGGMPIIDAARWLDTFLLPATLIFIFLVYYRFSRMAHLGLAVAILIFVFEPMRHMAISAMSEPLFIFLSVCSGFLLLVFIQNNRYAWLTMAALAASAGALTRYIGVAWIATGTLSILLFLRKPIKTRLKYAIGYLTISIIPVLIWFLWIYLSVDRSVGGRLLSFEIPGLFERLEPFRGLTIAIIWKWLPIQFLLNRVKYIWRVVILVGAVFVAIVASFSAYQQDDTTHNSNISDYHIFSVFGIYSVIYMTLLAIIYAFSMPTPDINNRMILPFFVGAALSFYAGISLWLKKWERKTWMALIPWVLVAMCVWEYSPENIQSFFQRSVGANLTSTDWQYSQFVAEVKNLPPDTLIITNQPEILLMWADRPAYYLGNFSQSFLQSWDVFGTDPNDPVQKLFREGAAVLVVTKDFYRTSSLDEGLSSERQVQLFDELDIYKQFDGGLIYTFP